MLKHQPGPQLQREAGLHMEQACRDRPVFTCLHFHSSNIISLTDSHGRMLCILLWSYLTPTATTTTTTIIICHISIIIAVIIIIVVNVHLCLSPSLSQSNWPKKMAAHLQPRSVLKDHCRKKCLLMGDMFCLCKLKSVVYTCSVCNMR